MERLLVARLQAAYASIVKTTIAQQNDGQTIRINISPGFFLSWPQLYDSSIPIVNCGVLIPGNKIFDFVRFSAEDNVALHLSAYAGQ